MCLCLESVAENGLPFAQKIVYTCKQMFVISAQRMSTERKHAVVENGHLKKLSRR
jgi:hypothetical protein